MMRVFGVFLLAAGSVLISGCAVRHLNERIRTLNYLIIGLNTILRELEYRLAPLPEVLEEASNQTEGQVAVFFHLCALGAEHLNGRTFQSVWNQASEAGQLRVEQADLDILKELGGVLGRYDGESQQQMLRKIIDRLEGKRREAEKQSGQLGKVYGTLGLTGGALILILMI